MFKYKEKTAFTYNVESVVHCRKFSMKQNVDVSCSEFRQTYLHYYGLYITYIFLFESLEKCMTFKDIFQDFLGPGILNKKARTFQEAWEA